MSSSSPPLSSAPNQIALSPIEEKKRDVFVEDQVSPLTAAVAAVDAEAIVDSVAPGSAGWLDLFGFGVFQSYYHTHQLSSATPTDISWIGSIQLCLCPLLGCVSGPLFDAGYLKQLIASGGLLYVFGLMMTSLGKSYYQYVLAHGIAVGLGMGIMFPPAVSTVSHHFGRSRYRSLAYGCVAAGSSIGGIIFPILARTLFPAMGFAWTVRIFAFIVLLATIVAYVCLSTVHPPRKTVAVLSPVVSYVLHVAGAGCCSMAIYCPLSFAVTYGTARGFATSLANYSLAVINGCSIFGRIAPVMAAQVVGPINVHASFAVSSAIMLFVWTKAELYIGMAFFVTSFFWLAGTPITAALIRGNDYLYASMFCGTVVMLGGILLFTSRYLRVRKVGTPWV
ncbi:hypothetical protein IAR55_003189 [Kwoniella newhampshirensis]|uniref:Major facilitator superfamily (MFS) profile domain-containing protein n=1 Tax=Kwoniella newhampshirensis TaxID=1651941 RepID=A0AAW0Z0S1_9TREE